MSDFTIHPDPIRSAGEMLNQIAEKLNRLAEEAETVTRQVHIDSAAMETVRSSLLAACTGIRGTSSKVSLLETVLVKSVTEYGACEQRCREGLTEAGGTVVQVPVRVLGAQSKMTAKSKAYTVSAETGKTVSLGEIKIDRPLGKEKESTGTDTSGSGKGTSGTDTAGNGKKASSKTEKGKNSTGKDKEYEIAGTGASGAVSGKIWSVEKESPFGKVQAEALSGEAHGSISAGLYARDNGDKLFADPRVQAAAGVTLCALSGSASGKIGNKNAGLSGTVEASVGKAEAGVTVSAGLRDKNGGLDPHLSGKASAELTAAEANASVKANLAGVEAKVTAGAKVGLGAHANVSIGGGTIHCDVGAALGVGANVGVDVNVSGAVKAVCDLAKAVGSVFTG